MVLDSLEGPDRPAELHSLFGVGHGRVRAGGHDADGLRRAERAGQSAGAPHGTHQHVGVAYCHRRHGHGRRSARGVEVLRPAERHALDVPRDHDQVVAGGQHEQVRRRTTKDEPAVTVEHAARQAE